MDSVLRQKLLVKNNPLSVAFAMIALFMLKQQSGDESPDDTMQVYCRNLYLPKHTIDKLLTFPEEYSEYQMPETLETTIPNPGLWASVAGFEVGMLMMRRRALAQVIKSVREAETVDEAWEIAEKALVDDLGFEAHEVSMYAGALLEVFANYLPVLPEE